MPVPVGAVKPLGIGTIANRAGIGISLLFKLLRASAVSEAEAQSLSDEDAYAMSMMERDREIMAQRYQLERMRAQSDATMRMMLAERGVSPMHTMGMGGGGLAPAHITAAAGPPGRVG